MAEAYPKSHHKSSGDVQVSVVLFNTDSSDKGVKARDRQECMRKVLDSVLREKYPDPLFVLCQDKIKGPKHEILCEKLGQDPRSVRCMSEAGVYYRPYPERKDLIVNYVDTSVLQKVDGKLKLDPDNDFTVARLMACVLQAGGIPMTLLVSWHGPSKIKLPRKSSCFNRLVIFCDRLREQVSCGIVILGGDFNFPASEARKNLTRLGQEGLMETGAVCDCYTPTPDRKKLCTLDYVVCWPEDKCQTISTDVIDREFRREKGKRPFDHPIVGYRFGCRPRPTVSTEQPQKLPSPSAPGAGVRLKSEE